MVGFDQLSPALLAILNHAIQSDNLTKYLYYNNDEPIQSPSLSDTSILLWDKLFPTKFDTTVKYENSSQLRVFFGSGKITNNMVVNNLTVIFDIIVAKQFWTINDGQGTSQIRPYMIMTELEKQFRNQSVPYVGKILFQGFNDIAVDEQFNGIRLTALATQFSSGNSSGNK